MARVYHKEWNIHRKNRNKTEVWSKWQMSNKCANICMQIAVMGNCAEGHFRAIFPCWAHQGHDQSGIIISTEEVHARLWINCHQHEPLLAGVKATDGWWCCIGTLYNSYVDFISLQRPADQPAKSPNLNPIKAHLGGHETGSLQHECAAGKTQVHVEQSVLAVCTELSGWWRVEMKYRYSVQSQVFCHYPCLFPSCRESVILHPAMWESVIPDGWV